MRHYWLNKAGNDKLILFFAGWGFDENPFRFIDCGRYDVLMVYDYSDLEFDCELSSYKESSLIAWSMGVFAAHLLKDKLPPLSKKIAVNGTPYPVHDESGIPVKIFELTLKHAATGLQGKFYKNVFGDDFERYMQNPVQRTVENRVQELENLYKLVQSAEYDSFYDAALISANDNIVPARNQIAFWEAQKIRVITLSFTPHFPFYNYKSWDEALHAAD